MLGQDTSEKVLGAGVRTFVRCDHTTRRVSAEYRTSEIHPAGIKEKLPEMATRDGFEREDTSIDVHPDDLTSRVAQGFASEEQTYEPFVQVPISVFEWYFSRTLENAVRVEDYRTHQTVELKSPAKNGGILPGSMFDNFAMTEDCTKHIHEILLLLQYSQSHAYSCS